MEHDATTPSNSPVGRRAILGGLAAGAGALGLGLGARGASAATPGSGQAGGPEPQAFGPEAQAVTAHQAGLNYRLYTGWHLVPLFSTYTWTRSNGAFRLTTPTLTAYVQPPIDLPFGSVIREIEVYGTKNAGGAARLELWNLNVSTGASTHLSAQDVSAAAGAGAFTITKAVEIEWTDEVLVMPFVVITDTAAGDTSVHGVRIGYEAVAETPAFVPISPIPRPYNTRDTAGLTKLNPGEERTITLPVPVGISAAVIQLTVTETGAGGFIGVFPADAASWPGNSSINWSSVNQNVGGTVITAVSADGKIKLRGGGSPTHVIIDVPGYLT